MGITSPLGEQSQTSIADRQQYLSRATLNSGNLAEELQRKDLIPGKAAHGRSNAKAIKQITKIIAEANKLSGNNLSLRDLAGSMKT